MTIEEAVKAFVLLEVDQSVIDLELVNAGFDGSVEYSVSIEIETARVAANVLSSILMFDTFSEGDLTVKYNTEGIQKRLLWLAGRYGFDDLITEQPKIRDRSNLW